MVLKIYEKRAEDAFYDSIIFRSNKVSVAILALRSHHDGFLRRVYSNHTCSLSVFRTYFGSTSYDVFASFILFYLRFVLAHVALNLHLHCICMRLYVRTVFEYFVFLSQSHKDDSFPYPSSFPSPTSPTA